MVYSSLLQQIPEHTEIPDLGISLVKLLQDFRVQVCVCVCVVGGSVAMLLSGQLEGGLQEDPCQGQVSGEREREVVCGL